MMDPLDAAEELLRGKPYIKCTACAGLAIINDCKSCMNSGLQVRRGYNESRAALGLDPLSPPAIGSPVHLALDAKSQRLADAFAKMVIVKQKEILERADLPKLEQLLAEHILKKD